MRRCVPLEKAAEQVCDESAIPPLIFQVPPEQGRERLNRAQDAPVFKYPANISTTQVDTQEFGTVTLYCIWPENVVGVANVIYYIHGAGWVFGNLHTHEKLVRELAARTNCVVLFPEYSLSPEVKYPTAVEQCYSILQQIPAIAANKGWQLNLNTLTVAGDSVGGNMATVMAILSKYRNGLKIHKQLLYYPVTNADFNTCTYREFACDYYLYRAGMMWFWDQYTTYNAERCEITASPLRATTEQLSDLPDAMIINGEADVLRDEGEAYARKLRAAGVNVTAMRVQATIHDFVMLNALNATAACRAAMNASTEWINQKNKNLA
ncbi:Alpha/beta hydrolase domain-containing protein [uncultured Eubacteriales bacterium]|uniref:Alpha/beta hydrolase domain-containing protein n=1 Tax=uncultured Eubacteriales bacterium TaxID=172733 RepID=A0A212J9L3_9FIRM|nr:Alpha/beta hydrolase domain-containing protein [uncultured Eubacteriales bacterium]